MSTRVSRTTRSSVDLDLSQAESTELLSLGGSRHQAASTRIGKPILANHVADSNARSNSAIVSVPANDAAVSRLTAAAVRFGVRAGRVRVAFHLYSTPDDVDIAIGALRG